MPRYINKTDVGVSFLGGIFQGMLDRRNRNWQQQDMASQQAQATALQNQRQQGFLDVINLRDQLAGQRTVSGREYQEEQGETPEQWKKYMEEKGIPYTGRWSTDKWAIDRHDDAEQEKARATAKAGKGKDGGVKKFSGGKLITEIEKQFPKAEVEIVRKIQTAYEDAWARGGTPSVRTIGDFIIAGGSTFIDVPTIPISGQEMFSRVQEIKGMIEAGGMGKGEKPGDVDSWAKYIVDTPNYWFNEKLAKPIDETLQDAKRNMALEAAVYGAMQFVPDAEDHNSKVINPAKMENAYRNEVGENFPPLQLGGEQKQGGVFEHEVYPGDSVSIYDVISAMEDAGLDPQTMVDVFERYQNPNIGADPWQPSPVYGTRL